MDVDAAAGDQHAKDGNLDTDGNAAAGDQHAAVGDPPRADTCQPMESSLQQARAAAAALLAPRVVHIWQQACVAAATAGPSHGACQSAHPALITSGQHSDSRQGMAAVLGVLPCPRLVLCDSVRTSAPASHGSLASQDVAAAPVAPTNVMPVCSSRTITSGGGFSTSRPGVAAAKKPSLMPSSQAPPQSVGSASHQCSKQPGTAADESGRPQDSMAALAAAANVTPNHSGHAAGNLCGSHLAEHSHAAPGWHPGSLLHASGATCCMPAAPVDNFHAAHTSDLGMAPVRAYLDMGGTIPTAPVDAPHAAHTRHLALASARTCQDMGGTAAAAVTAVQGTVDSSAAGEMPPAWFASGAHLPAGVGLLQYYMQHPPGSAARDQLWAGSYRLPSASLMAMPLKHFR